MRGPDLTRADVRCGIKSLPAEIERLSPGAILQQAAGIQLRRLGCVTLADHRDRVAVHAPSGEPCSPYSDGITEMIGDDHIVGLDEMARVALKQRATASRALAPFEAH